MDKHALCNAEGKNSFAEEPLVPANLRRDDGHSRLLHRASTTPSSSPHLLTLEAADHEGVTLPALGRPPQLPEPVGLRGAGEEDVLELLWRCTVFCGKSMKA